MCKTDIDLNDYILVSRDEIHKLLIKIASLSPAKKRKVGALLVDINDLGEYTALAAGYNYNLSGGPCEYEDGNTHENVIHAEVACINNIAKDLEIDEQTIMLITHPPCDGCKAAMEAIGIPYEVFGDFLKFDTNKPRMALVPPSLSLEVAEVLTYGAKKYKPNNWRKVRSRERYISALERHLCALKSGEEIDPESGLPHATHIACNAAFLIELKDLPLFEEDF